jgi:hypothetical protein
MRILAATKEKIHHGDAEALRRLIATKYRRCIFTTETRRKPKVQRSSQIIPRDEINEQKAVGNLNWEEESKAAFP